MKCPHCRNSFYSNRRSFAFIVDKQGAWAIAHEKCPECNRAILTLLCGKAVYSAPGGGGTPSGTHPPYTVDRLIHPRGAQRPPAPPEVTDTALIEDYTEACLVLPDSAKASAALSRRCLQHLLRTAANVKRDDLAKEIQEVLDSHALPSHLAENLDAVRHIGNYAAHPNKSQHTGEIVNVEPAEAEWNLDVLEGLFDFYFVQPELSRKKRDALTAKLATTGKASIKKPKARAAPAGTIATTLTGGSGKTRQQKKTP